MVNQKTGAIIVDPSFKYLLAVRGRYSQKWGPPKGSLDPGETHLSGALREINEEVGVSIKFPENCEILPRVIVDRTRLFIVVMPFDTDFATLDPAEIAEIGWLDMDRPPHQVALTKIMRLVLGRRHIWTKIALAYMPNYDLRSDTSTFYLNQAFCKNPERFYYLLNRADFA